MTDAKFHIADQDGEWVETDVGDELDAEAALTEWEDDPRPFAVNGRPYQIVTQP